jgi:hypothetical protein
MDLLMDAFQAYELLRGRAEDRPWLQRFLANNFVAGNVLLSRADGQLAGVAVAWRIADPLDVNDRGDYPGRSSDGKYAYIPLIHVRPELRLNGNDKLWVSPVLLDLLSQIWERFPGIKAVVGRRPEGSPRKIRTGGRPIKLPPRDPRRWHIVRSRS